MSQLKGNFELKAPVISAQWQSETTPWVKSFRLLLRPEWATKIKLGFQPAL